MAGSDPRGEVGTSADGREDPPGHQRRHSRWIWVSALLGIIAVGVTIWALTLMSDLDDTEQELDKTKQEQAGTKKELGTTEQQLAAAQQDVEDLQSSQRRRTGVALVTGKVLYDEFAEQLGAAQDELAETQQDVKDANMAATQAEQDAAAAKQDAADADTETDKAKAEAKQAKAESQAAQSRAQAARGCAKAYIEAFGGLFEGDSASAQAETVRKNLQAVTADCKDALAGT
jgi:chromosome segregation ATPase